MSMGIFGNLSKTKSSGILIHLVWTVLLFVGLLLAKDGAIYIYKEIEKKVTTKK